MKKYITIVPALLTSDSGQLEHFIKLAETFTNWVQIDFMDGRFVPSTSISTRDIGRLNAGFEWEAHLMVLEPENELDALKAAGASRVIFHYEATRNHQRVIDMARELGIGIGMALNPATPAEHLEPFANSLECVLFMSVNPGFYGAPFIAGVLDKIRAFKDKHPDMHTSIDGGAKQDNIGMIATSGVDSICVGSAIFLSADPASSYQRLINQIDPGC